MKGAIADPPPKTTSAPIKSKASKIGSIQNFFRFFKKPQTSERKFIAASSIWGIQVTRTKRVFARHKSRFFAVTPRGKPHGILSHHAPDYPDWEKEEYVNNRENDFRSYRSQNMRQAEPELCGKAHGLGQYHTDEQQPHCSIDEIPVRITTPDQ